MEFDKALTEYMETLRAGRKMQLEILLREIKQYEYTTINQLVGAIHTHLELMNDEGEASE